MPTQGSLDVHFKPGKTDEIPGRDKRARATNSLNQYLEVKQDSTEYSWAAIRGPVHGGDSNNTSEARQHLTVELGIPEMVQSKTHETVHIVLKTDGTVDTEESQTFRETKDKLRGGYW